MKYCPTCCDKVYPFEKVETNEKWYHRRCFRCSEQGCKLTLTLQNFQCHNGLLYCNKHVPKYLASSPKMFKAQIPILHSIRPQMKIVNKNKQVHMQNHSQGFTFDDIDRLMVSLNTTTKIPLD